LPFTTALSRRRRLEHMAMARATVPISATVMLVATLASPQTPSTSLFAAPSASSTALELTLIPGMSPLRTVYLVDTNGTVRRQKLVEGTLKLWSEEVTYVSRLEVSNLLALVDDPEVRDYTPTDLKTRFPDGVPFVSDSTSYILRILPPPEQTSDDSKAQERTISMAHPKLYEKLDPTFAPARVLTELRRLLDLFFD
jgi:hypothetical protein